MQGPFQRAGLKTPAFERARHAAEVQRNPKGAPMCETVSSRSYVLGGLLPPLFSTKLNLFVLPTNLDEPA